MDSNKNVVKIKYKKIENEITLSNFGRVNYLIGKNGSGKSSVLEAFEIYYSTNDESIKKLKECPTVQININSNSFSGCQPRDMLDILRIHLDINTSPVTNVIPNHQRRDSFASIRGSNFYPSLNYAGKMLGQTNIEKKVDIIKKDFEEVSEDRIVQQDKEIDLDLLASGHKKLAVFVSELENKLKSFNKDQITFLLIEEPESHLHPSAHKIIPEMLNDFVDKNKEYANLYFWVTTHSNCIASSSFKYENQKCYLLEDGYLYDVVRKEKILETGGYDKSSKDRDVILKTISSSLLGVEPEDIGYPENICIVEENATAILLSELKGKIIKDIQFISTASNSKIPSFSKELDRLETLCKTNIFYHDTYLVIVDNYQKNTDVKDKLDKIKQKIGDKRFKELNEEDLEDYYKNLSEEIYEEFKIKKESIPKRNSEKDPLGELKNEYAKKMAREIKTKEDFSKLFNNELDFLLI